MAILPHAGTAYEPIGTRSGVPGGRIVTRQSAGAEQMELWEQFLEPGDEIPLHYHQVEEALTFLSGEVDVWLGEAHHRIGSNTTVFVPAGVLHRILNVGSEPVRLLAFFPTAAPAVCYP